MSKRTAVAEVDRIGSDVPRHIAKDLIMQRIMRRVVIQESGCWEWTGPLKVNGYPTQIFFQNKRHGMTRLVHDLHKDIPLRPDQDCCHTCDNRRCINPDHLWAGTRKENLVDCLKKGRHHHDQLTHCPRGHAFEEHGRLWDTGKGTGKGRACKACVRGRMRVVAGWPEDLAYSLPPTPPGQRPFNKSWARLRLGEISSHVD